ncbi:hypothetical protein [uncultured Clostridium sp.]|uniref:hypothetical protein n=1 Tax=uncultured Clostridium sp. TaxID=59620 RepID=UPI0028EEC763|nr:hypothetical protein [uncultured Clostridium sp.]
MAKIKKTSLFLSIILVILLTISATYYIGFYPKTKVIDINTSSNFNGLTLLDRLSKNDLNLSSKEISLETSLTLSEEDLSTMFIGLIKESNNKLSNLITGLKVDIDENKLNVIFHLKYNGIPLEGHLVFNASAINDKCVLHYHSGNVGFININKDLIFSKLRSNDVVTFDKTNGDIILSISNIDNIKVKDIQVQDNNIIITIKGSLTLDDLNKLKLN